MTAAQYANGVHWNVGREQLNRVSADAEFRFAPRTPKPARRSRKRKTDWLLILAVLVLAVVFVGIGVVGAYAIGPTTQHVGTPKPVHVTWPVRSRTTHLREV